MAIGVIVNSSAVLLGGIIGSLVGSRMDDKLKDLITSILGVCAISMGIPSIVKMQHLPVVVLSILIGSLIGVAIRLEKLIANGGLLMQKGISKIIKTQNKIPQQQFGAAFLYFLQRIFHQKLTYLFFCIVFIILNK